MIIRALRNIFVRSLENPSTPLSAGADWLYDAFGAMRAGSGMRVSRETSLTYAPVWRAINLISRDVATLPLMVQKRQKPEGWLHDEDHPAHWIISHKPNSEMTAFVFWQVIMYHVLEMGNAYGYIYRYPDGSPEEIVVLLPDMTYPIRADGQLWYITKVHGDLRKLDPSNVLHIKGVGYDGLAGYAVVQKARESWGLAMAQERFASIYFRNNAMPSFVLEHPATLSDQALKNLLASWQGMQGGLDNAHKPKILEEGMQLKPMPVNAKDAQLQDSRQFQVREVANWFNLPPHKLGDNSRLAYNSLEQENQSYLDDALNPWLRNIEQECWDKLLTEKQKRKGTHRIYFDREKLIHANLEAKEKFYVSMVNNGMMNPDQVAQREGWNPLPNDIGQQYRIPTNIAIIGEDGVPQAITPPIDPNKVGPDGKPIPKKNTPGKNDSDNDPEKTPTTRAHRELLVDTARRMVKRLSTHARKAAKTPGKFNDWLNSVASEHEQVLREAYAPTMNVICGCGPNGIVDVTLTHLRHNLLELAGRLSFLDFEEAVNKYLDEYERTEPEVLADTVIRVDHRLQDIAKIQEDGSVGCEYLFIYGSFYEDPSTLEKVVGHKLDTSMQGRLRGYVRLCGKIPLPNSDRSRYCTLVPQVNGEVIGSIVELREEDFRKTDEWERWYRRHRLEMGDGMIVYAYMLQNNISGLMTTEEDL